MPRDGITHLRIYCVCGQKMKVSEEMFGRPGKCIACRQKIRIPYLDELPVGAEEIYLKDHPEFQEILARIGELRLLTQKQGLAPYAQFMNLIGWRRDRFARFFEPPR